MTVTAWIWLLYVCQEVLIFHFLPAGRRPTKTAKAMQLFADVQISARAALRYLDKLALGMVSSAASQEYVCVQSISSSVRFGNSSTSNKLVKTPARKNDWKYSQTRGRLVFLTFISCRNTFYMRRTAYCVAQIRTRRSRSALPAVKCLKLFRAGDMIKTRVYVMVYVFATCETT